MQNGDQLLLIMIVIKIIRSFCLTLDKIMK